MRTEVHFHLLPGVDDGPRDDGEALALARQAVADGTGHVVATPHAHAIAPRDVAGRVAALRALLQAERIPLAVSPGAELLAADVLRFDAGELDDVAHGPEGRRWVLLEAPLESGGERLVGAALARLGALGFGVLVAHPERSPMWWSDPLALERALAAGARLQVNASSLTGYHGAAAQERGRRLFASGRVSVLASDAHGAHRPACLTAALEWLARDAPAASALADEHPAALLERGLPPLDLSLAAA